MGDAQPKNERVNSRGICFMPLLFFYEETLRGLKLYEINPKYIKYLAQYQEHIFISDGNKASRKYIGIVLQINGMNYFAPLSSFKPKHKKMKESVDFIKIRDYAVININNMVPVPEGEYHLVDVNGTKDMQYNAIFGNSVRKFWFMVISCSSFIFLK